MRVPRGIIPALAGNTATQVAYIIAPLDHPRSRGEYLSVSDVTQSEKGSSPLSRGIRSSTLLRSFKVRIIPALAGNTGSYW